MIQTKKFKEYLLIQKYELSKIYVIVISLCSGWWSLGKKVLRIFHYRGLTTLHTFNKEATVIGRFLCTSPMQFGNKGCYVYMAERASFSRAAISSSGQRFFEEDRSPFFVQ
ncbi:hypothetical protein AM231_21630 [Paenibacillus solani]|uniref:Uncharacterized protein n=1 Tax=Paenibacillus solani TaxID=1705565 RepID=A0A0M1N341_9BACL|nr:hypothetical protein AM231_21630 [Paenibacillus solani]